MEEPARGVRLVRRLVGGEPDVAVDAEDLRLMDIKPDLAVGITVGAGHFIQIEVPDQVNAMIDRFLAVAEW
jgi:pimeloyl-ACP methyl ester carboxylesterase